MEKLDVVQVLENYEQQTFQSIEALKCVVPKKNFKMVKYLLSRYNYPLNVEYLRLYTSRTILTEVYTEVRTEVCSPGQLDMIFLLMEHEADLAKKSEHKQYQCAVMIAINNGFNKLVAHFIRSGMDLDCRLHDDDHGVVLPFEYAVIKGNNHATEMFFMLDVHVEGSARSAPASTVLREA